MMPLKWDIDNSYYDLLFLSRSKLSVYSPLDVIIYLHLFVSLLLSFRTHSLFYFIIFCPFIMLYFSPHPFLFPSSLILHFCFSSPFFSYFLFSSLLPSCLSLSLSSSSHPFLLLSVTAAPEYPLVPDGRRLDLRAALLGLSLAHGGLRALPPLHEP